MSPGAQLRDHALENGVGVLAIGAAFGKPPERAEVHIERKVGAAADLGGHFQNLDAPAREAADLGVALDAAHDVLVGVGGGYCRVNVDAIGAVQIGVVMALKTADQIGGEERINPGLRLLDDEVAEAGQRHAGGTALVDHGGHA